MSSSSLASVYAPLMASVRPSTGRKLVVNSTPWLSAPPPLMLTPKPFTDAKSWMSFQSMWKAARSTLQRPSAPSAFTPTS